MKLPDPVLTFKLLDGTNISNDERKLGLKFCVDLKYEKMKSALKRLFAPSSSTSMQNTANDIQIKQEETFFNKKLKRHRINELKRNENKVNPLDKHGKIARCVTCDSLG